MVKEFKINEKITLKLENQQTNIYIGGELFRHCKYILLEVDKNEIDDLQDIDSIDEASGKLNHLLENIESNGSSIITPEDEFWAHCSNLQVWVENNCDTRLLHSNLSFPLLSKLSELNDPIAIQVYKDEIAKRFSRGYYPTIEYLWTHAFLKCFNTEELEFILSECEGKIEQNEYNLMLQELPRYIIANGWYFFHRGEYTNAIDLFKSSLKFSINKFEVWLNIAESYYEMKNYGNAIVAYESALKLFKPQDLNVLIINKFNNLFSIYRKNGEHHKTIKICNIILETRPKSSITWYHLYIALDSLGKPKLAKKAYKKFKKIEKKSG